MTAKWLTLLYYNPFFTCLLNKESLNVIDVNIIYWTIAPEENCPPTLILTLTLNRTLTPTG